uniref:Uncharacterized protein n=1 Tax=Rhabditophanes sp. KR3021 TaxID=114890 RepID=A0AC35TWY9_9BILA
MHFISEDSECCESDTISIRSDESLMDQISAGNNQRMCFGKQFPNSSLHVDEEYSSKEGNTIDVDTSPALSICSLDSNKLDETSLLDTAFSDNVSYISVDESMEESLDHFIPLPSHAITFQEKMRAAKDHFMKKCRSLENIDYPDHLIPGNQTNRLSSCSVSHFDKQPLTGYLDNFNRFNNNNITNRLQYRESCVAKIEVASPTSQLGLRGILKRTNTNCEMKQPKSVRWSELNKEHIFEKEKAVEESTFNFQRLLNALKEHTLNAIEDKKINRHTDEPITIDRKHTFKKRIILLPKSPMSLLRNLNLQALIAMLDKTYKYKVSFKYTPRRLSLQQWKRVDLIFVDSLASINFHEYKINSGALVNITKQFPIVHLGLEGETYQPGLLGGNLLAYQFPKYDYRIGQHFCDWIKNVIERHRFNRTN